MSLPPSASELYRSRQRVSLAVLAEVRRLWRQMGPDFNQSWRRVGPRIIARLVAGQTVLSRQVEPYMTGVLDDLELPNEPVGAIVPGAFVGINPDGNSLAWMSYGAVTTAKGTQGEFAQKLAAGGKWLDMATVTTLADTQRQAIGAAITARPTLTGWVRMVNPPSCSRCLILAGRFYRWNQGFPRHPACDCIHIPATENVADDVTTDPNAYFNSISAAEQDRMFGKAGAQAIRDGADMGQVVNARSGMYTTADGARATRTGTSRRGRAPGAVRLMPEQIYKVARTRDEAIELLARFGFIA
jgi:hypothetical protein